MLEALTAAIVAARPIHSPQPRRSMRASSAVAARASITPASDATARHSAPPPDLGEYDVGEPFPGEPRLAAAG